MIKLLLLFIAIILSVLGFYLSFDMLQTIATFLLAHPAVLALTVFAIVIQLVGHVFRAMRTKLVLDQAASSSLQFQFGALSMGYLFNTLFPFRFGELIRAFAVARRLHISFLYTLVAVAIERLTDVLFLGVLILLGILVIGSANSSDIIVISLIAIAVAAAALYVIVLLKNENKHLLKGISAITGLFNTSLNNTLRFKVWSLIFGLQSFLGHKSHVKRYVLYATISWVCYFISTAAIVVALLSISDALQVAATSISPYILSVNPLHASSYYQLAAFLPSSINSDNLYIYAMITWAVLTLPMAGIGLLALAIYKPGTRETAKKVQTDAYVNKLMRHKDISQDFPSFLDSYFSGNNLAKILHNIEVSGKLSLVRFFKGGSDAITILVLANGELFVKKIIPIEYRDRLKAQYDWLRDHQDMKYLVKVLDEQDSKDYYAIDLEYDPKNIPFFEYAHHNSLKQSQAILQKTWDALYDHLHKNAKALKYQPKHRDAYVEKHIIGCMDKALESSDVLQKASKPATIVINGETYDNLYQILDKIRKHKTAWRDIATYQESGVVHGDPSIDNILVSLKNDRPFIIDPAPDGNIINGAVFDLGKWMQSFYCGYEFLFRDDDPVELGSGNSVNYREYRTEQYVRLCNFVRNDLAPKYLSEEEQRALIFHGGALLIRRLKHQVHYNPGNSLKLYAVGVKALNDFLAQYEKPTKR